jgi:hypothetical protein
MKFVIRNLPLKEIPGPDGFPNHTKYLEKLTAILSQSSRKLKKMKYFPSHSSRSALK